MPEHVNWDAVFQSITDTWLPLIVGIIIIIVVIIIVRLIRNKKM